jgi:pseudaminic acid synthase
MPVVTRASDGKVPSLSTRRRTIDSDHPTYVVAEMSANHNQSYDQAVRVIEAAHAAGADAVKLQTYTADTLTIRCDRPEFVVGKGSLWEGRTLHDLYQEAHTPWDWHPRLKQVADRLELDLFSTPFDDTSVDFLEKLGVEIYKIASFELVDLPLIRKVAATGKPIVMSTGMASLAEIDEAVRTARAAGATALSLLKCTSAYPAAPEDMNLRTIPHLGDAFGVVPGLSDHTMGIAVPAAAVALGARIVEKHFTLSRSEPGPDSAFSLEPQEFKAMVESIRTVEKALGTVSYESDEIETKSKLFRRSLFIVEDVRAGERLSARNVRCIRPGHGLAPRFLDQVLGRTAIRDLPRGTPVSWNDLGG